MSRKEPKTLRVAGLRPFLPQTVPGQFAASRTSANSKMAAARSSPSNAVPIGGARPRALTRSRRHSRASRTKAAGSKPSPTRITDPSDCSVGPLLLLSCRQGKKKKLAFGRCFNFSKEHPMSMTGQPQTDRPDPSVIAAQNDAFRKLACLGVPTAQSIQGACMSPAQL